MITIISTVFSVAGRACQLLVQYFSIAERLRGNTLISYPLRLIEIEGTPSD